MNLKYTLGSILSLPLLPLMYYQGKKIKASVPDLPEATGTKGVYNPEYSSVKPLQLLTIGESTIAGVGVATHEEGFTGTLAKELSPLFQRTVNWKVYAQSGYTAKKVTQTIIPEITEKDADLIVVGLGANDAFTLNRPKRWRQDIAQLIQELKFKFPPAIIVFCNMPPIKVFPAFTPLIKFTIGNLVEILGDELDDLIQGHNNVFYNKDIITLQSWVDRHGIGTVKTAFFSDGVHPSKLTYQTWAKDIVFLIENEPAIKSSLQQKLRL